MARGLGPVGYRVRRLHPDDGGPPHGRRREAPQRGARQRAGRHLPGDRTRASTASSCEAYYTEDELIDGICPIHERPVERMHRGELLLPALRLRGPSARALRGATREAVEPETRRNEVLSTIRGGLQDFSISRTSFDWGIPLPWDPKHVCYVWFDALTNYITAAGLRRGPRAVRADVAGEHPLIGKDILRFHADLLAGDADGRRRRACRRQVWAHGFLTVGGKKMSKTNATGIHPFELLDLFGVDSYRYYFMREIQFGAGRQLLVGVDGRPPQRRSRERAGEPRQPRARHARERPSAAWSRRPPCEGAESDLPDVIARRRSRPIDGHMLGRRAVAGPRRRSGRSSPAPTTTWSRRSRGSCEGPGAP